MRKAIQIQYREDFEYALKCAADAGFKHISMGFGSSNCFHESDWEKHIMYISKLLKKIRLNVYKLICRIMIC